MNRSIAPSLRTIICLVSTAVVTFMAQSNVDATEPLKVVKLKTGRVFLDGEYLPPPYKIETNGHAININGQELTAEYFGLPANDFQRGPAPDRGRRPRGGPNGRWPRGEFGRSEFGRKETSSLNRIARKLEGIELGATAILYENTEPLLLYSSTGALELVSALISPDPSGTKAPESLRGEERSVWERLTADFVPSQEFIERSQREIANQEETLEASDMAVATNLLIHRISYPLTVFAMIAIALAVGHLMSERPFAAESSDPIANQRFALKTLGIIAAFSAIDLVWTFASSNSGTMRELNPLASGLVKDPVLLTTFKFIATGTAIGLFYALRNQRAAQLGCWWCCLLLMLLTSRWVVFQSLFS